MPKSDAIGMVILMAVAAALAVTGMGMAWLSRTQEQRARMNWRPLVICLLVGVCLIAALLSGSF